MTTLVTAIATVAIVASLSFTELKGMKNILEALFTSADTLREAYV